MSQAFPGILRLFLFKINAWLSCLGRLYHVSPKSEFSPLTSEDIKTARPTLTEQ